MHLVIVIWKADYVITNLVKKLSTAGSVYIELRRFSSLFVLIGIRVNLFQKYSKTTLIRGKYIALLDGRPDQLVYSVKKTRTSLKDVMY